MIGPSNKSLGGIATVVNGYTDAGLFDRWNIVYLCTHIEGTKFNKMSAAIKSLINLFVLLLKRNVSLVHVHSAQGVSFWRKFVFILVAFSFSCPVVFHLHAGRFMNFYHDRCGKIQQWLIRFVLRKSARIIVLSCQWEEHIFSLSPESKIVKVFNAVDVKKSRIVPDQKNRKPVLLYLGRLNKLKGIYDLLEAINRVRITYPDILLKCGGDGELDYVSKRVAELGIDSNVKILGWVSGDKKQALMDEASIYVLPSYFEGLPMGVLESMADSLPVVASAVGGIPDVIDSGKDGILIAAGDIDALVDAIEQLLGDAALRSEIGQAARKKIVDKFSMEIVLPQIEKIYRELGAQSVN